ncbi:MAG: hypothetical protein NC917_02405 [Candidatus Omnitrophica bacterium]|nr:hypothetical protein [Candidatus Omnitrophota bacterium]MCM8809777.1 hypothetical protein [Candidatus Omnitrophota bacterium]MCM8810482.1 hypothetical protein [Candidatus Omnitrophota bacterium]
MSKCFICKSESDILIKFKNKKNKKFIFNFCKNCLDRYNLSFYHKKNNRKKLCCPVCGYTIDDFKEYKFLGCDFCYEYFLKEVSNYMKKIHTNILYKGKYPRRFKKEERFKKFLLLNGFLIDGIIINGKQIS